MSEKGNLEKVGESMGAIAGKAADTAFDWMTSLLGGAASRLTNMWSDQAEQACRTDFEQRGAADKSYDAVRPLYQFGHLAGSNPDYQGRSFDEVESDLQNVWTGDQSKQYGDWKSVRDYISAGYMTRNSRGGNI